MAIEDFVRDFNRHLDDAIGKAMEGGVADAVRTAIVSAVESEVYSERVYKRSEDYHHLWLTVSKSLADRQPQGACGRKVQPVLSSHPHYP